jgi:hypothetical protein
MTKRSWKHYRPTSLQDAIEACVEFARDKHQMSIERIADAMGLASKWTLYKYIESASIPARLIRPFETACRCSFVTAHLAASARKLLIDFPTGRKAEPADINAVQTACNGAVNALIQFADGSRDAVSAALTLSAVTHAIETLARERAEVERFSQPELNLI